MDIKEQLKISKDIYELRKKGLTTEWSASTKCLLCGAWWLWGIEDNLYFTCGDCVERIKDEVVDLEIKSIKEQNI